MSPPAAEGSSTRREVGLDDVVEHFTLGDRERELLRNKSGSTRLGFAAMLKFLGWKGRFPRGRFELPDDAIEHLARQVKVAAVEIGAYDFAGRQIKNHRREIRSHTGFRICSVADAEARSQVGLARISLRTSGASSTSASCCSGTARTSGSSRQRPRGPRGSSTPVSAKPTRSSSRPSSLA